EKPLTHSTRRQMLDLRGWNAQGTLILGDQRAGDIVTVPRALFDRIARRHPVALAIKQHPGEQAGLTSACASVVPAAVAGWLCLNRLPRGLIDVWGVFGGMGLSLVNDLAAIGAVPQHQVERAAREWLVADHPTCGTRPRLAVDAVGCELRLQQPHRAEFGI